MEAQEIIERLGLRPLPGEGGHYVETYRSGTTLPAGILAGMDQGVRALGTAIYFLLKHDTVSALHRLPGDEIWHFYMGDPVEMLQLHPDGRGAVLVLGTDLAAGMQPQVLVPAGVWQGSRLARGGRFALLGTTMSPGFDFEDYEPGEREALTSRHPEFAERILVLTPPR